VDQFAWDPLLDPTRVVVSAKDGEVILTGSVPTYYEVSRAADDAKRVGGVTSIDNRLLVGLLGDAITDGEIAVAAAAALDADKFVPNGGVDVDVVEGWLTLSGEVRHHYQRLAAERAVGRLDGVLGLTDKITMTSDPIPTDVACRSSTRREPGSTRHRGARARRVV
jgi:BON domain